MKKYDRIVFKEPQQNYFELSYFGRSADMGRLDMYDATASFYGFSRTIAILGHFYSTGIINAHAPRSEVQVFIQTSEPGSYKQMIVAVALGAVIGTPLTTFINRVIDSWIPSHDPQLQQVIELLEENNRIMRNNLNLPEHRNEKEERDQNNADEFIEQNVEKINVLRSITASSFKDIFRPIGRSADFVGISVGRDRTPIGAVNERALRLIESDRPEDDVSVVIGVVSSFSRSSKTGVAFSQDIGRGFRFEYKADGKLPPEDDFSWSQFYQRPIRMNGRFVLFFDGKIKKLIVYSVERLHVHDEGEFGRVGR